MPLAEWLKHKATGAHVAGWVREIAGNEAVLVDGSAAVRVRLASPAEVGDLLKVQLHGTEEPFQVAEGSVVARPTERARRILAEWRALDDESLHRHRYVALREPEIGRHLRSAWLLRQLVTEFFRDRGFLYVDTPLLGRTQAEYTSEDYLVVSRHTRRGVYSLPQSAQLYKQMLVGAGVWRYFQISRCFRDEAERADVLREFNQVDVELAFTSEEELQALIEDLICHIFDGFGVPIERPFRRISLAESLAKYGNDKPALAEGDRMVGIFITDMPMAKRDHRGRLRGYHHPMMAPEDSALPLPADVDLTTVRATGFDLVLGGIEIASGNMRAADVALQRDLLDRFGMPPDEQEDLLGSLLEGLEFAFPPHGGFGVGFERLLGILDRTASLKDIVPFPKYNRDWCPLTRSPFTPHGEMLEGCRQVLEDLSDDSGGAAGRGLSARAVRRPERSALGPEPMDVIVSRMGGCRFPMHIGGTFLQPPASFLAAAQRELGRHAAHQYAPVGGIMELRQALAAWHSRQTGRAIDASQVLVTSGAGEASLALISLALEPEDAALLLSPHWHLVSGQVRSRGARIDEVPFFRGGQAPGPERTRELLERSCRPDTRLLYLATPNNPDGAVLDAASLEVVVQFARERDLWLLCDEVYDRLVYAPGRMTSAWSVPGAGAKLVTLHSFSKSIGVAGARIGYLIADPEAIPALEHMIRHASFCASPVFQAGCLAALEDQEFFARQLQVFDDARQRSARALDVRPPDGGIYHFFPVRGEAAALAPALLRDTGVAVLSGAGAGEAYGSWMRVCFTSLPPDDAEEGARRVATWLHERGQRV